MIQSTTEKRQVIPTGGRCDRDRQHSPALLPECAQPLPGCPGAKSSRTRKRRLRALWTTRLGPSKAKAENKSSRVDLRLIRKRHCAPVGALPISAGHVLGRCYPG